MRDAAHSLIYRLRSRYDESTRVFEGRRAWAGPPNIWRAGSEERIRPLGPETTNGSNHPADRDCSTFRVTLASSTICPKKSLICSAWSSRVSKRGKNKCTRPSLAGRFEISAPVWCHLCSGTRWTKGGWTIRLSSLVPPPSHCSLVDATGTSL